MLRLGLTGWIDCFWEGILLFFIAWLCPLGWYFICWLKVGNFWFCDCKVELACFDWSRWTEATVGLFNKFSPLFICEPLFFNFSFSILKEAWVWLFVSILLNVFPSFTIVLLNVLLFAWLLFAVFNAFFWVCANPPNLLEAFCCSITVFELFTGFTALFLFACELIFTFDLPFAFAVLFKELDLFPFWAWDW